MKIAIIGGGIAGLAAAARLSAQHHEVTIYEKNSQVGGRMSRFTDQGFTFDMGPTIVMMPDTYYDVFHFAGKNLDDYLEMKQLPYLYDVHFADDDKISIPTDLVELRKTLENIEEGTTHGFMQFLTDIYQRYEIAREHFLERAFRKPTDFYNPYTLYQGMRLKTFGNAQNLIDNYVENDKIRKMLAFQTLYIGIDPKRTPSLYTLIPMVEMMFGVHYIKGGMYGFTEALKRLNEELGTRIVTNAEIEEIVIDSRFKQADGVKVDGQYEHFDKVLCTADFPYAAQHLFKDETQLDTYPKKKIDKMDYACSAFLMYIGIDEDLSEQLRIHNVIFAEDFEQNIDDIFSGRLPKDPSIYLHAPSVEDPALAPKGKTGIYALMPVPELKVGQVDWENPETIQTAKQHIYAKLNKAVGTQDIESQVLTETIFTPKDFENEYNAKFGTAFGLMPTLAQSNYYRPHNVSRDYKDLYFAGASVHPGAGVPIVLTSAKVTVDEMLKDIENGV